MNMFKNIKSTPAMASYSLEGNASKEVSQIKNFLIQSSESSVERVYEDLKTSEQGLSVYEVESRLEKHGSNKVLREKKLAWYWMVLNNFKNPFVLVLILLGAASYFTDDQKGAIVVSTMVVVSVIMRFMQEYRSSKAAETLQKMVRTYVSVKRQIPGAALSEEKCKREIPLEELVPGDIIYLSAGDMIPADVRLIHSKDLFISQSALTGESLPVEKGENTSLSQKAQSRNPLERSNLCFMGTNVISGFGKAIVLTTGAQTYFGALASNIVDYRPETSFDKGINSITWMLIRFIAVMIPIIFLVNGWMKGDWQEAFLFAVAVAVGLTPEMLPVIVTANLAKGAVAMSYFKVIVKRLNSIQSLGAMDVLCTDKTGTLTQDKIILEKYLNPQGGDDLKVLEYAFLNSYYQSGLKNMLDKAILIHPPKEGEAHLEESYQKIDEIPFDFNRKRMSVVLGENNQQHLLICKGAVEELIGACSSIENQNQVMPLQADDIYSVKTLAQKLSDEGFRVIGVAFKQFEASNKTYSVQDETGLTLLGLMAFLDPVKETAKEAIKILNAQNVKIKILTGDNDVVTRKVCKEVDLPYENILLGEAIENMPDEILAQKIENTTIFAKLSPLQKSRVIRTLQRQGHVVGFLGDGINDAPALRDADVGISVDTATDIARESADIILLEKSLLVLGEGVLKGREVYGNMMKYIKMTTSSNFGNVLSVLIGSLFLPFLPMLPLQLLIQNLLYDFCQLSIPWDKMDKDFLEVPRKWEPKGIAKFMVFIGPISSVFDLLVFFILWNVYKANTIEHQALFQSAWFVEGLLSQALIVHLIRTKKIPFIQSRSSALVGLMTILVMGAGLYLPFTALGEAVGLCSLPLSYFGWLAGILLGYCTLLQIVKNGYIRRFKNWL